MEDKNISLVVLGVIGVIAVLGLVLMFSSGKQTGAIMTSADCPPDTVPIIGASAADFNSQVQNYENRGFTILSDTTGVDVYGNPKVCAAQPRVLGAYVNKEAGQNIGLRPAELPL